MYVLNKELQGKKPEYNFSQRKDFCLQIKTFILETESLTGKDSYRLKVSFVLGRL